MVERNVLATKKVNYAGVFDAQGLFDVLKAWSSDKGYALIETSHSESLKAEGKFIEMIFYPVFKAFNDYVKGVFRIHVQMKKVKDIVVEHDGKKVKMKEGVVTINITALMESDYDSRWEAKPLFYVLRTMVEKYVLSPFIGKHESAVRDDLDVLLSQLKSFLNIEKFRR